MVRVRGQSDQAARSALSDAVLGRFVGYHLKRAQTVMMADMNACLKPFGLRMITFSALAIVAEHAGLRQAQLADALAIERPNLVVILDDLENRGLISRDRVPTDRRAYALTVTPEGRKLYGRALRAVEAHEARALEGLSDAVRENVIGAMTTIRYTIGDGQT